ncbi:MAG: M4 family metallopeptidase [Francisellaceae bacterium]
MEIRKVVASLSALISISALAGNLVQLNEQQIKNPQELLGNTLNSSQNNFTELSSIRVGDKTYTRYQQTYKGIDIIGAQVILKKNNTQRMDNTLANGVLVNDINVDTNPAIDRDSAIANAMADFNHDNNGYRIIDEPQQKPYAQLKILPKNDGQDTLVYVVSFRANRVGAAPKWMFYYIDPTTAKVIQKWDNIQNYNGENQPSTTTSPKVKQSSGLSYQEIAVGGNQKTGQYYYGANGIPYLIVRQENNACWVSSDNVDTVDLHQGTSTTTTPALYTCGNWYGDMVNGAYSAVHDAQYFGEIVYDLYEKWYSIDPLYNSDSTPRKLTMRVHYGQSYENAFWDGQAMTMNFGDGYSVFYPLVSLDVSSHEVSHGFTQQHSNLIYANESGSLNEAFSDMAGQAARAYLLSLNSTSYKTFFPNDPTGEISWKLGEMIYKTPGAALRYMNAPSTDGISADCVDKSMAGKDCKITYQDVVNRSGGNQGYIVHTGSGVFNKAFYLLSSAWARQNQEMGLSNHFAEGVKEAFHVMLLANLGYWTPNIDFSQAACDVIKATKSLNYNTNDVVEAFEAVGISTETCNL